MKGAKFDLASALLVGFICVIVAYFLCNFLVGEVKTQTVRTLKTSATATVEEPSVEVFNYKAINPTVEAYIGECQNYNTDGTCIEGNNSTKKTTEGSN